MTHPIYRVARFDIVGPHKLAVVFTDGTTQEIDFRPVLHGAIFGPLRALALFNAVTLDQEVGTLTWPNGADFDPATLHEWSSVCDELSTRAQAWKEPTPNQPRANEKRIRVARSRDTILGWTKSGHERCEWGSYGVSASDTDAVSRRDGRSPEVCGCGGRGGER